MSVERPQLLREEGARLARMIDAVAEKRTADSPERVRLTAPPMEEQDRDLGIAVMWEGNFALLDEWTTRMGYDPKVVQERASRAAELRRQERDQKMILNKKKMITPISNINKLSLYEKFAR